LNTSHGALRFWKKGVIPAGKEFILTVVDQVIADYVDDLGGEAEISAGQNILLHNLKKVMVFQLLVDEHLSKHGIIDDNGIITPALSAFYLAAMAQANRIIEKLGTKRLRGTETWAKYLASREAALAIKTKGKASTKAGAEIKPLEVKE
jgi:hypothetical protein